MPDRDLRPGGRGRDRPRRWQVYETPGHAPSHVVLYQPERGLLLSGDHLLGRVSLYYDYGWTPDPAGEFLRSLDVVEGSTRSCAWPGHGRPFATCARTSRPTAARCTSGSRSPRRSRRAADRLRVVPEVFGEDD